MKIYLMTDMEGCAGMMDHDDWVCPTGRYYETGKELLTREVNAAVEGFFAGGATDIVVSDGHGHGGIDVRLLDPRAKLMRGWPGGFPFLLDRTYDAVAWVGQHAKAGTPFSHITHTQSFEYIDLSVNGVSIGELGQFAMCASELGIPSIFAAGEKALADEARALVPGIETVAVKEGTAPGTGDDLSSEAYAKFHLAAIHLHPVRARELICEGASRAVRTALARKGDPAYGIVPLAKPFRCRALFRRNATRPEKTIAEEIHPDSVIQVMNMPFRRQPVVEAVSGWPPADPNARPFEVQASHLLCAVCVRGGSGTPPCGRPAVDALLAVIGAFPHAPLLIKADLDVARAHYRDVYENRGARPLPPDFQRRSAAYVERYKDLEVCRVLGVHPNTVLPAYVAYTTLFRRQPTLRGVCRGLTGDPHVWPECPHANAGCYEKIAGAPALRLGEQTARGEDLAGHGIWALFRPRTRAEMSEAKRASAAEIVEKATRLFIRPNHLLCIVCTWDKQTPLIEDNLIELRRKMEANPDIPVTLTEGCCMVCDPCNIYHPGTHLCFGADPHNLLRDLRMLQVLGLPPGATLSARELYRRIYERIEAFKDICGWGDGSNYAPMWAPCIEFQSAGMAEAKSAGFLA